MKYTLKLVMKIISILRLYHPSIDISVELFCIKEIALEMLYLLSK